jgi:hypothetical protein
MRRSARQAPIEHLVQSVAIMPTDDRSYLAPLVCRVIITLAECILSVLVTGGQDFACRRVYGLRQWNCYC